MKFRYKSLVLISVVIIFGIVENSVFAQSSPSNTNSAANYNIPVQQSNDYIDMLHITVTNEGTPQKLDLALSKLIFNVGPYYYVDNKTVISLTLGLKPELANFYREVSISNASKNQVFVYPILTQAAYSDNGFYYFYNKKCDTRCLTVNIPNYVEGTFPSSVDAANMLALLNYSYITDIDIDKNPNILKKYDRVILLHNEYVTKTEFDAITSHPNVLYLYPNALYSQVKINYETNTITLINGHGYPTPDITNAFNWKFDNSKFEYDVKCDNWAFYKIDNGKMLNCYPEYRLLYDYSMLRQISMSDQNDLLTDSKEWIGQSHESISNGELLDDAGINANKIPSWLVKPALWFADGKISQQEFMSILGYLHEKKIIV